MTQQKRARKALFHFTCVCVAVIMLYPLLWMLFSSFKVSSTVMREADKLLPTQWTVQNFINGWKGFAGHSFGTFFRNSLLVAGLSTIGAVFSSVLIAYGFARIKFRGSDFWFACMMVTLMLPFQVIMVPQFLLFTKLGWTGTYLPLIVPFFCGQAFFIYMDVQFMRSIPKELDEAAMIDGCSRFGVFWHIMLPLCVPVICTSAIFSFIWRWEDFLGPFLYLNKPELYTASLALKLFSDPSSSSDFGAMFAMATLSVVPACILFVSFQKYLVEGIATTGLKG
ncbi:MAG: carbohydrate ABC transporter permease [Oscillospiraceae bacterium]|nr:carbohydrate ABC transporter permease [Oscillospiraceae bacterium]